MQAYLIERAGLQSLIDVLRSDGRTVLGPVVRDGAVTVGEITSVAQLPRGVGDEQEGGHYRLRDRGDEALFGFAAGRETLKPVLFPSRVLLWQGSRDEWPEPAPPDDRPVAVIGARGCDLAAVALHDRALLTRAAADPRYATARARTFVVAVACGDPAGTCFCASMGTGPRPTAGFDLALTELLEGGHRFLVEVGTPAGADVMQRLPEEQRAEPDAEDVRAARAVTDDAATRMGRTLDTDGLRDLLYQAVDDPSWEEVASRCLACGSCTLACPTCFCTGAADVTDLTGDHTERWRVWDSCFDPDFSRLHGGAVRSSVRSRYRQWMTHKLGAWVDQFGVSGCVGCGRCITWCPVGIDITQQARTLRDSRAAAAQ